MNGFLTEAQQLRWQCVGDKRLKLPEFESCLDPMRMCFKSQKGEIAQMVEQVLSKIKKMAF